MTRAHRMVIEGKRYVVIRETEYERLCRESGRHDDTPDAGLPPLPKPDRHGNYPAIEYTRVSIARDLARERRALGLSQSQLARSARVRQETISRIESGRHSVTTKTYDKLFDALQRERDRRGKRR